MEKLSIESIKKWTSQVTLAIDRNKSLFLRAFAAAVSVLLICTLLFDIQWRFWGSQGKVQDIADRPVVTQEPVAVTPTPEDEPEPTPTPRPLKPRIPNERDINFEELSETNPDIMGWIEIPGTKVDYPVVTTYDNEFYLEHNFFGKRDLRGTIFADIRNNPDWEDPFVVLYGHNNKDGSMFSSLRNFRRESFFDENKRIIIYTPDGQLEYRVFAVYARDDDHLMGTRNFRNPAVMRAYLDEMQNVAEDYIIIDLSDVDENDSILALSVCANYGENRFIVHAVFVPPAKERGLQNLDNIK